ncbi:MAG: hypothetical protein Q7R61_00820 [bacterium]|nr:hypothetical protein [bacterium]
MEMKVTPEQFKELLPSICDKETSSDPDNWTPENPLWGHCAVVSLVAQNLFGGELLRGSLMEVPGFEHMRSHYWNKLADRSVEDFTKPQFGEKYPEGLKAEAKDRFYVLSFPATAKRYKLLAFRLAKLLSGDNPLFDDPTYKRCFYMALDSPCQKKKFGCVIVHNGVVVYEGFNHAIRALKSLCEPKCIRLNIASRTESMLGACGHAEEWGIWRVIRCGIPISECALYVAGINPDGLPLINKQTEFTCLRCAVQMYNADIRSIYVPVIDHWGWVFPERAIETARAYATGEKKV